MILAPDAQTPYVVPYYFGGPWDGGFGALEPTHSVMGCVRLNGGIYQLEGFQHASLYVHDKELAKVAPDRSVYRWEAGR